MDMADDFVYRPRYEMPHCNQVQVFKMNDDGSITYTDIEGDLSQTRYVPERTCKYERSNPDASRRCNSCDFPIMEYSDLPNYCPNCGAKVVE